MGSWEGALRLVFQADRLAGYHRVFGKPRRIWTDRLPMGLMSFSSRDGITRVMYGC